MSKSLIALPLAALLLSCASCCVCAPHAEKYFARTSPLETTKMLQYAVETKQWKAAYESLTPETQSRFSFTKFELGLRFVTLGEKWGDLGLRDFIVDALRDRVEADGPDVARVFLVYDSEKYYIEQPFVLRKIDGQWLFDLTQFLGAGS